MKFLLLFTAFILFLPSQSLACSSANYESVEELTNNLLSSKNLTFIGTVKVLDKVEIDKYVFYQFEVVEDVLGGFLNKYNSYFVGYTTREEPLGGGVASFDTCSRKAFEVGDEVFLRFFGSPENKYTEPYYISANSTFFSGFSPEDIKKQIELMK